MVDNKQTARSQKERDSGQHCLPSLTATPTLRGTVGAKKTRDSNYYKTSLNGDYIGGDRWIVLPSPTPISSEMATTFRAT